MTKMQKSKKIVVEGSFEFFWSSLLFYPKHNYFFYT